MDPNDDILVFIPDRVGYMTAPNCFRKIKKHLGVDTLTLLDAIKLSYEQIIETPGIGTIKAKFVWNICRDIERQMQMVTKRKGGLTYKELIDKLASGASPEEKEMIYRSQVVAKAIKELDLVEVVKCKDCRFFEDEDEYGNCYCNEWGNVTNANGYCHDAERKEKMRLIDADKCPVCGGARVNESDEWLDICRQEWNYCPVCGRFIGDEVDDGKID